MAYAMRDLEIKYILVRGENGPSYTPIIYHEGILYQEDDAINIIKYHIPSGYDRTFPKELDHKKRY